MQPFIPPTVTAYDPTLALAWGFLVAAVPLVLFIVFWAVRKKGAAVTSLAVAGIAFAVGSSIIGPLDSERETTAIRAVAVNEWLDEMYPQYGGASLNSVLESGDRFGAVADDGKYREMYFSFDDEFGYRLVALTGKNDEAQVLAVGADKGDLDAARVERDTSQE